MGIPSYFYSIIRAHGDKFFKKRTHTKRLFLDLNCCIHGCKNRILKSFPGDITTTEGSLHFENKVIQEVIRTIIRFCKETNPTELLWIAVDGVVPLAKMVQQRERRLRAAEDRQYIKSIYDKYDREVMPTWDSNAITPGTPFMIRMCDTIKKALPIIQAETGVKDVQMNGVRIPGEGEQKIFEYMRNHPGTALDGDDVIYGLDADLIVLSLLHTANPKQTSSIYLLREQQEFGRLVQDEESGEDVLLLFSASEFAKTIPREWSGVDDLSLLDDYVILMSLMGNDFVPHTPSLTFRDEGMERILDAYRSVGKRLLTARDMSDSGKIPEIQWDVLADILERLERYETKILIEDSKKTDMIRERIRSGHVPFKHAIKEDPVEQEIAAMDWEHIAKPDIIRVNSPGWRHRYYKSIAGIYGDYGMSKMPDDVVNRVCQEYLYSIGWCWNYYNGVDVPGDKCYSFASGPLMGEVITLLRTKWSPDVYLKETSYMKVNDIPVEAQLLVVLPKISHHILPKWVRDIADECPDLYPNDYGLWYFGKRHIWECTAILPRIPIRRIALIVNMIHKDI